MRQSGTEVLVVLPPYQTDVLAALLERPVRAKALASFLEAIDTASADPGGPFPVCRATRAEEFGCDGTEFMDGYHMLRSCAARVIRGCASRAPGWTRVIPAPTADPSAP